MVFFLNMKSPGNVGHWIPADIKIRSPIKLRHVISNGIFGAREFFDFISGGS